MPALRPLPVEDFADRHIGPDADDVDAMLATVGVGSLDELIDAVVPGAIREDRAAGPGRAPPTRRDALARCATLADRNQRGHLADRRGLLRHRSRPP